MSEPIRVAQIMGRMDRGGVETVVTNYYRWIDKSRVQYDFFLDETSSFPQKEELEKAGAGIYYVPPYGKIVPYIRTLRKLFTENGYRIVHAHINTMNVFPLYAAWRAHVPVRICHNHSTAHIGEGKKTLMKYLLRPLDKLFATNYFACGIRAGRWMYGNRCFDQGRVYVMNNAFDVDRFAFSAADRAALRGQIGLMDSTFVMGHVGRFTYAKNHRFLLQVFAELHKERPDSVLVLIGEGEMEAQVRRQVKDMGLDAAVRFLGVVPDAYRYYSVLDVFCLPSFYEGLSLVGLEAQANGLPCVFSENVPNEIDLTGRVRFLPFDDGARAWAKTVLAISARRETDARAALPGFSVAEECVKLEQLYLDFYHYGAKYAAKT